jgi:hypothetical protein
VITQTKRDTLLLYVGSLGWGYQPKPIKKIVSVDKILKLVTGWIILEKAKVHQKL